MTVTCLSKTLGPYSLKIAVIFVYSTLIALRGPGVLWPGRFWAEEGTVYFYEAYTRGVLEMLTQPHLGYYSLFNKLASLMAVYLVPLEYAPLITGLMAAFAQVLPAFLLLYSRVPSMEPLCIRVLAVFLVLLVQPNQEVWLNTANSQFFLCVATAVILISHTPGRVLHVVRLVTLTLAGLTGVLSVILFPFFIIEYIITRHKNRLHELIAIGIASTIQGLFILSGPVREITAYWNVWPFALLVKQWILPFFGPREAARVADVIFHYDLINYQFLPLLAILPFALFLLILVVCGRREIMLLFCCSFVLATLSFLGSAESRSPELIVLHVTCWGAPRYYFAPNVMLGFSLLALPRIDSWRPRWTAAYRMTRLILVAMMLIVGSANFIPSGSILQNHFTGPIWSSEVEAWAEGKQDRLAIWPRPWSMKLPRPARDK